MGTTSFENKYVVNLATLADGASVEVVTEKHVYVFARRGDILSLLNMRAKAIEHNISDLSVEKSTVISSDGDLKLPSYNIAVAERVILIRMLQEEEEPTGDQKIEPKAWDRHTH